MATITCSVTDNIGTPATTTVTATISASGFANSEVTALSTSISPTPSQAWLNAADTLVSSLKTAGVWSALDLFYCLAAPNQDAVTWNWKNTAVGRLTASGSLIYTTNTCVNGDGATGYFSSTFTVNSGLAVNGNAHFGYFCLSEDTTDNISVFQTTASRHYLGVQSSNSSVANAIGGLNTSTTGSFSTIYGSTVGHFVLQQNTTTSLEMFLDGVSTGTSTQTNSADTGTVQLFKTAGGAFTTRKTGFVHYGSKLTAAQQLAFSKALYKFLTTMDVRPRSGYLGLSTGPTNVAPYQHVSTGDGGNIVIPATQSSGFFDGRIQGNPNAYPYGFIRVGDPNYLNVYRLETHVGDNAPFDGGNLQIERMQLAGIDQTVSSPSAIIDCAYSFFIEPGTTWGNSYVNLGDYHETVYQGLPQCGPSPAIDVLVTGSQNFYFWAQTLSGRINEPFGSMGPGSGTGSSAPCAHGVWHHVRMTWRMGAAGTGFCQCWFDGTKILDYSGVFGYGSGAAPYYMNLACYQGSNVNSTETSCVWFANFEWDHSGSQPFTSRVATPLPCPVLT